MRRSCGVLVVAALLAPGAAGAQGGGDVVCTTPPPPVQIAPTQLPFPIPIPGAAVMVNGLILDLTQCLVDHGKRISLGASFFTPSASGTVTALFDPDPFISFGATTTTLVPGPVTFAFLFGTPVVAGSYTAATSTGGVTVTNGAGGTATVATSLVHPTYISGYGSLAAVPTNLGVDLGTLPCTAGPGVPFTVTTVCGQGLATNTFAATPYDNLEALLTYTQTDVAAVASWSGAVTLSAIVPEPASLALLATGALVTGMGVAFRRRVG